jgi:hypothetical protein
MPFHFDGSVDWRNEDGSVESAAATFQPFFWWKSGASGGVVAQLAYEDLRDPLPLPEGTGVPAGAYAFWRADAHAGTSPARRLQASAMAGAGSFYDGWRADASVAPIWNASRHLRLTPSYGLTRVGFPSRDQGFSSHILRLRVEAALDTRLSLNAFVQYASSFDALAVNARLRFNLREGNDVWLVYSDGLNTDRFRPAPAPALPLSTGRTLLLKYTYTVGL